MFKSEKSKSFSFYVFLFLIAAIYTYKPIVYSLPEFRRLISHDLKNNLLVSFFSDTFLLGALVLLVLAINVISGKIKKDILSQFIQVALACFIFFGNAFHIRYIEHFGTTAKPFLFDGLAHLGWDGVIFAMVFSSPYALAYMALTITVFCVLLVIAGNFTWKLSHPRKIALTAVVVILSNVLFIKVRHAKGVQMDISQNSISAVIENLKEYQSIQNTKIPSPSELQEITNYFHVKDKATNRNIKGRYYPLFQNDIENQELAKNHGRDIFLNLKNYITRQESLKGPWNINIVILESALSSFINHQTPKLPPSLSPNIDRYIKQSIFFNQAYAAGRQTKDGQVATMCSIIPLSNYHLMNSRPSLNSQCLGDILHSKGYDTYFIYPSDNNFDNQHTFYRNHSIDTIIGEANFNPQEPKAGWGFSDHSLFKKAQKVLRESRKPFFSTILTLSHHSPYVLPSNAPDSIRQHQELDDKLKVFAYMDWAFGQFMDSFSVEHPHTITIFLSDQGSVIDPQDLEQSNFSSFEKNLRIPIGIYIPDLPHDLRGTTIDHMVSALDVTPTLVSLLSYKGVKNQFIGKNLFFRNSPIFIREENYLRKVSGIKENYKTESTPKSLERIYTALFIHDLMFPRTE